MQTRYVRAADDAEAERIAAALRDHEPAAEARHRPDPAGVGEGARFRRAWLDPSGGGPFAARVLEPQPVAEPLGNRTEAVGDIETVLLRGNVIVVGGEVVAEPGSGQFVKRARFGEQLAAAGARAPAAA